MVLRIVICIMNHVLWVLYSRQYFLRLDNIPNFFMKFSAVVASSIPAEVFIYFLFWLIVICEFLQPTGEALNPLG